jgi:hypothetical protein
MPPALSMFQASVRQKLPAFVLTHTGVNPDGVRRLLAVFSCSFLAQRCKES